KGGENLRTEVPHDRPGSVVCALTVDRLTVGTWPQMGRHFGAVAASVKATLLTLSLLTFQVVWQNGLWARRPHGSGRCGRRPPTGSGSPTDTSAAPPSLPALQRRSTAFRPHGTTSRPSGAPAAPARPAQRGACFSVTHRSPCLGRGAPHN